MPATVISQDPDNYALNVSVDGLMGGQMPSLPVKVLTAGSRDALLGHYPELPRRGTRGLVVFARGDLRSGHWIGATDPALVDASTLSPGVGNASYFARFDGGWTWRGEDGTHAEAYADGSTVLIGNAMPAPTRHTLDGKGVRQRTAFPLSERVSGAVGPFQMALTHVTGSNMTMDVSGNVTVAQEPATNRDGIVKIKGSQLSLSAVADDNTVTEQILMTGSGGVVIASNGSLITLDMAGAITIIPGTGQTVTIAASGGGSAQAVRLADGTTSTVLRAE